MHERIEINPKIHFGKPCVKGTRIPVVNILELVGGGLSFDQIIKDCYPDLAKEDIRACVEFAADLVAGVDADFVRKARRSSQVGKE